jgi:cyclase
MRIDYLASDILLFQGDSLASLATAFIDDKRVLLIDALASTADAEAMRAYIEDDLHKRIEQIVLTHSHDDHMAGLALFPQTKVIANQALSIQWGRHTLELFHNPGMSADMLAIDVPSADLLFAADNLVGNIAYLGAATPDQLDAALLRLQARHRGRVVPGHLGVQDSASLDHARHYLQQLGQKVGALRATLNEQSAGKAIAALPIDTLLAPGVQASSFEHHWHKQNLLRINERALFPAAPQLARGPGLARRCCDTVMGMLTSLLGGLARQGV